ncbi:MAG: FAD-binding oxidoreductase [Actinomycetota bacterium]|nr:FAD-binding oxidoreductase [Actinomycetota bacterium]
MPDPGAARSFWLQEALGVDPGEPCPPLEARVAADVCIVGGGFAGLWTAIELSHREPQMRIALLEQDICGGGASGRNGGFFSSSWWDLPGLVGLFGEEEGTRYALTVSDAVQRCGSWLKENGVDAWFHADGALGVRTGTWQDGIGSGEAPALCARLGLSDRMVPLGSEAARAYADSPRFVDGVFIPDAAVVQPARLARGLRRVALERGVRIFERTKAIGIERSRPAVVSTERGAMKADQVVVTIGAWGAGWPEFRRSFGVIADYVVVTEPIPDLLTEIGWTSNVGIGDGRDLLFYLRPTDDGRIAIGGGATGVIHGGTLSSRVTHDRRIAEVAARGLMWLFPQLEGVRFTHAWGGPIDMTASFTPFFRTLAPGSIHAGLGFSGHGLSQTMVGGNILTSLVLGVHDEWTSLPVVGPEIAKTPPEPLRWPLVRAAEWALEAGDRRADTGSQRGRVLDAIGSAPLAYRDRLVTRRSSRRPQ